MLKNLKIVYIRWCDAIQRLTTWDDIDYIMEWADNEDCLVDSVGWLLKETDKYVLITSKISGDQVGQSIKIPKTWIKIKKYIK